MNCLRIAALGPLAAAALAGCLLATKGTGLVGSGPGGGSAASSGDTGTGTGTTTGATTTGAGVSSSGSMPCTPGTMVPCYTGPAGTEGVGPCHGGMLSCLADGSGYSTMCQNEITPEPDNCAAKLNSECVQLETACTGATAGGRAWGEPGNDRALGVAIDSQGNTLVGGLFHPPLDFGSGAPVYGADASADAFVAKYDVSGALVWLAQLGDTGDDQATAIAVDKNDDVLVVGSFTHQITFSSTNTASGPGIFVAKLSKTDGHPLWGNGYRGDTTGLHLPQAVAVSQDGATVAVAGYTQGQLTIGGTGVPTAGDLDGFLFTLDGNGTQIGWVRQIRDGGGGYQTLSGVAIDADGSVVVTGTGENSVDFGDGPVTAHGNGRNVAVARYPANGGPPTWSLLVGDNGNNQYGFGVALGAGGDVFLTGTFQQHLAFPMLDVRTPGNTPNNTNALFVARLDKTGKGVWGAAFTPPNDASGQSVAVDGSGVVVGGYFSDQITVGTTQFLSKGGKDALAFKLSADKGDVLWAREFGGVNDDIINAVAIDPRSRDPLGASVVAGQFGGIVDVGGGPPGVVAQGMADIFFARLAP